jgi:hypothetical protein
MPRGKVSVRGVACTAKGCSKSFSSLAGVRKHYRDTGHETFRNVEVTRTRVNPHEYAKRPGR